MEFLAALFTVVFVAIIIGTALTFGVALLIAFMSFAVVLSLWVFARRYWIRWRFVHNAERESRPQNVIEGEYRDISDNQE